MPEILWQPTGPSSHTIPDEWNDLLELTIARCDCGALIIKTKDDYGKPVWKHMRARQILFYRIFAPQRIGMALHNTPVTGRGDNR